LLQNYANITSCRDQCLCPIRAVKFVFQIKRNPKWSHRIKAPELL